jgi:hypothetical protein
MRTNEGIVPNPPKRQGKPFKNPRGVKSCSIQGFNPEQKTKRINEDKLK